MKMKAKCYILLKCYLVTTLADLPPEIQKCKSNNNDDCVARSMEKLVELYPHGNSDIGLQDISAITLKDAVLAESKNDSPVQLNFKFKTLTVGGLEKLRVLRAHGFVKNLTKTVELDISIPKVTLDGDYEMAGKLLLLPLNGKGKGKIDFFDALFKFKAKVNVQNRNNKNYGTIDKIKLWELEPKRMVFNLQNVLNNNAILSESINEVINENWRDLWNEFKENIVKISEDLVKSITNNILNVLSVDDFYSD